MAGHVARMGESRTASQNFNAPPTGKRLLVRSRRSREDNIRMDLKEIVINARNWVD